MKKLLLASAIVAASLSSVAQAEVSANFGATSNYVWRGASQSGDQPSISGGIDFSAESGFYAGTWIGSLDYELNGASAGSEVDYYFGFAGDNYDVGYIYYNYITDDMDNDFGEIYAIGSVSGFEAGVYYTTNHGDANEGAQFVEGDLFYYGAYGFDLNDKWSLGLTVGSYDFKDEANDDSVFDDYHYYQADLGTSSDLGDFTYSISKTSAEADAGDTRFVVSWGIGF